MKKFLIVHRGAMGDFVCTWPVLGYLKKLHPECSVSLVSRPDHIGLARDMGLAITGYDSESALLLPFFTGSGLPNVLQVYDTALLWLADPDPAAAVLKKAGIHAVTIPPFPKTNGVHAADHHLDHVCRLLKLPVPEQAGRYPDPWRPADDTVLFAPGSGSPDKNHPLGQFLRAAELVAAQNVGTPAFIIGPAERDLGPKIGTSGFPVHEPASATDLARLLVRSRAFIGNDSGPGHLAAYLGVPSLALFKSTDPAVWGIRGRRAVNRMVEQPDRIPDLVRAFLTA